MALNCRTHLAHGRRALRALSTPALARRAYATDSTPESFKISTTPEDAPPRWSRTPPGMEAPWQLDHAKDRQNKLWHVNSNPARLDEMYEALLGPGGSKLLPEELKWLAVTHKSFDQGRRGFNDRLALMGRLTLVMEATKDIVSQHPLEGSKQPDEFEREAFENEQLQSVDNLNVKGPKDLVGKGKLSALADSVELIEVMRWKPRLPKSLESSGVNTVLAGGIMAIVGALTLQHGSVVASKIVRERILSRVS